MGSGGTAGVPVQSDREGVAARLYEPGYAADCFVEPGDIACGDGHGDQPGSGAA